VIQPIITKRPDGEYSTVRIGEDIVETIFFGKDGTTRYIGRTVISYRSIAQAHIAEYERENES
jgi:hypothetical protein